MSIRISYLLTIFNKKKYLQITLPYLISQIEKDEEVIIYDAGSTDGTVEFLQSYIRNIPQHNIYFQSEKDFGEAHGLNKCLLKASGKYLKIISDDDAYYLPTIRRACNWLDKHEEYDWMGSNGLSISFNRQNEEWLLKDEKKYYDRYKKKDLPFFLTGLSYLIRKKSLPKLGLFNLSYKIIDFEYSMRNISNQYAKLAISEVPFYVNIINPDSNSFKYYKSLLNEYFELKYQHKTENQIILFMEYIKKSFFYYASQYHSGQKKLNHFDFNQIFLESIKKLEEYYNTKPFNLYY